MHHGGDATSWRKSRAGKSFDSSVGWLLIPSLPDLGAARARRDATAADRDSVTWVERRISAISAKKTASATAMPSASERHGSTVSPVDADLAEQPAEQAVQHRRERSGRAAPTRPAVRSNLASAMK